MEVRPKIDTAGTKSQTDLKKRVYMFSLAVIRYLKTSPKPGLFLSMYDQLLRSSTSVGANIIEAKAASSRRDFIKYYEIALKSSHETRYWLFLGRDGLENNTDEIKDLIKENEAISKIITSCLLSLKRKQPPTPVQNQ